MNVEWAQTSHACLRISSKNGEQEANSSSSLSLSFPAQLGPLKILNDTQLA